MKKILFFLITSLVFYQFGFSQSMVSGLKSTLSGDDKTEITPYRLINQTHSLKSSPGNGCQINALLLTYEWADHVNDVHTKLLATGSFNNLDIINNDSPTLATLLNYDAILVWADFVINDAIGETLADYIDLGGGVVSMCGNNVNYFGIEGTRFNTEYSVVNLGDVVYSTSSLGTVYDVNHPIIENVNALSNNAAPRSNSVSYTLGSVVVAEWADGLPLVVVKENLGPSGARRADINLFPPSSDIYTGFWDSSTDGAILMANALVWVANEDCNNEFDFVGGVELGVGISGLYKCVEGDLTQPVPYFGHLDIESGDSVFLVDLPAWAEGVTELTFEWTLSNAGSSANPASPATHTFSGTTPFNVVVTDASSATAGYQFVANFAAPTVMSSDNDLLSFWFELPNAGDNEYGGLLTVDEQTSKQMTIDVPFGTDITTLVANFTVSPGAILTHSEDNPVIVDDGVSPPLDYTTPVAFTVHAEDCTTIEYFITVNVLDNADNFISSLSMDGDGYDNCMAGDQGAMTGPTWTFEENGGLVYFEGYTEVADAGNLDSDPIELTAVVPFGTDPASIVFDWTGLSTGATVTNPALPVTVSGFPASIDITVLAENMISERFYTLKITEGPASPNNILGAELETDAIQTFYFPASNFNGIITDSIAGVVNQTEQRIDLFVPYNKDPYGVVLYDPATMVACFDFSEHACVYVIGPETTDKTYQESCVNVNDFTEPVHYTVIAQNGDERYYNVYVEMALPDTDNSISELMATGLKDCNGSDAETLVLGVADTDTAFTIRVPSNAVDPDIIVTYDIPELADGIPASGFNLFDEAVSGVVTIVVTAESGDEAEYTITIDLAEPSDVKEIVEFSFEPLAAGMGNAQFINGYVANVDSENEFELTVAVPFDTDLTNLVASFMLDDEYASITHSEDLQHVLTSGKISDGLDYTTPVAFTVFAEDCSTVEYFVTVIPALEEVGTELGLDVSGTQYDNCHCEFEKSIMTADVDIDMDLVDNVLTVTAPAGTVMDTLFLNVVADAEVTSSDVTIMHDAVLGYFVLGASGEFDVMVTAPNGVDQETYTIEIESADPLDGVLIEEFYFTKVSNPTLEMDTIWGMIDQTKNRIDVYVPYGTPDSLIVDFVQSPMACVFLNGPIITDKTEQCSAMPPKVDFSDYQTYTVVAQNGDEAYYNVYVEVLAADTDTFLNSLVATNLDECFGEFVYSEVGVYDETDIDIPVKEDADVSAVEVTFDVPEKATVTMGEEVLVPVEENGLFKITVVLDLTSPVEITVTAQDPEVDPVVYTVSAVEYTPSNAKRLLSYDIGGAKGNYLGDNIFEVWVPWLTDLSSLVGDFKLSAGAKMTHSEDNWILQKSGETWNDFTYPVAFTVWAEDCTTEEFFVIVHITPNTNTGISQFSIPYDGCFCDADATHMRIDEYAKRIYVQIPFADANGNPVSLSSLTPTVIGIADGATVSPKAGVAKNFANGPVTYTVTAPDGETTQAWTVLVENPPCDGTDVLDISFHSGQFEWTYDDDVVYENPVIDTENHSIHVLLVPGTDLTAMSYDISLECGATICCNAGACAGQVIDFSGDDNCHICVVTAQDKSITQEWTICVEVADVVTPKAYTTSVLAMNCSDSVMVHGDKDGGNIYIVDAETAAQISYMVNSWSGSTSTLAGLQSWMAMNMAARDLIADAMDDHMAASAGYPYADSTVAIMTDGIYKGKYYAVLVDAAGNVSCASEEALYIDVCVKEVANLCDLRAASPVFEYIVTGEVLVTYEEGEFKFIQDDNCGIKVIDEIGAWPHVYGEGTGLTNIKGTIDKTGNEYKFYPVCCYSPEKSSTGNTIIPVELTWDGFMANCYTHERGYESMLVRITDPMIAFDDYSSANTNWVYNMLDLATIDARDNYEYFIQQTFNANYIGTAIPTVPTVYQGIRTNVDWGDVYGLITPRKKTDIIEVTAGELIGDPNPASIDGVLPGVCSSVMISVINQGVGNVTVSALYLDDLPGTDEFNIVDPAQVPFVLGTWESFDVEVEFCPKNAGDESTVLLVEYGVGKVIEIPINGTTATILDMDWCNNFNDSPTGDVIPSGGWTGTMNANSSVYPSGTQGWGGTPDASIALFLRNRLQVGGVRVPIQVTTPGVRVTGNDPVISWVEMAYSNFNSTGTNSSPRNLWISTDGISWTLVDSYLTSSMPDPAINASDWFRPKQYSLKDYIGETIWWKFELISNNSEYIYWILDNVCIQEAITEPILTHSPDPVDLGGVQVNETATQTISFTNIGISVAKIKSVEIVSSDGTWTLTDTNTYPAEITDGTWAYAVNGTDQLDVDVTFAPTDIGVSTAQLIVTWGMYSDKTYTVNLSGEGLSCATATEAFVGENWAPGQNIWFTYTAEKFQIVNINSCHPFNTTDPYVYSFDTYMYIYDDCDGNLLAENDDLEWDACPYNRASSGATLAMNEGETVKIFFPWVFESASDDIGFYMNIEPSYPVDGDVCETAIPLTLPVVNHFGSTVEFADDYDMSPCSPFSNYMDGNDKVYSITLEYEGYLTGSILGAYGSIHVLDMCPVEELEKRNCKAFTSGPNGGDFEKRIQAGTYYVIISTWAPPQTVDYLLNLSFRGLGIDDNALTSSMKVYPNPTQGMFTVSISNAEVSDLTLELVNISGQTVYRNEVKSVYSYTEEIDASSFAKGVYYLKVNDGEEVKIEKVVIQ